MSALSDIFGKFGDTIFLLLGYKGCYVVGFCGQFFDFL